MTHPLILWGALADASMVIRMRQRLAQRQAAQVRPAKIIKPRKRKPRVPVDRELDWAAWAKDARSRYRSELNEERHARRVQ